MAMSGTRRGVRLRHRLDSLRENAIAEAKNGEIERRRKIARRRNDGRPAAEVPRRRQNLRRFQRPDEDGRAGVLLGAGWHRLS
jgi:hypothetical protein